MQGGGRSDQCLPGAARARRVRTERHNVPRRAQSTMSGHPACRRVVVLLGEPAATATVARLLTGGAPLRRADAAVDVYEGDGVAAYDTGGAALEVAARAVHTLCHSDCFVLPRLRLLCARAAGGATTEAWLATTRRAERLAGQYSDAGVAVFETAAAAAPPDADARPGAGATGDAASRLAVRRVLGI
jgi:hypothetical protein